MLIFAKASADNPACKVFDKRGFEGKISKYFEKMQIQTVDSRTFPVIWNDLTKPQQEFLSYQLIKKGCTTTRQTVWNWATGKSRPATAISRNSVVKVLEKALGIRAFADTLFPAK